MRHMFGLNHKKSFAALLKEVERGWEDVESGTVPGDEDQPVVVVEPEPPESVPETPMMKHQPTELDKLPIDEEGYAPTGADELGRATRLLFRELPDEVSGWMWNKVKKLCDKVNDTMEDHGFVQEDARIRRIIRKTLSEARNKRGKKDPWARETEGGVYPDEPSAADIAAIEAGTDTWGDVDEPMATLALSDEDADMLAAIQKQADPNELDPADRIADEEEAEEEEKKDPKKRKKYITTGDEGVSLKDLAKEFGFSGPAGIKNMLYRITDQMQYFASLDEVWFKQLMEAFAIAYVEELKDAVGENLTPEDVVFLDDLMSDPDTVMRLPEFRMWAVDYLKKQVYKKGTGKSAE